MSRFILLAPLMAASVFAAPVTVFTNFQGGNSGGIGFGTGHALAVSFTPSSTAYLTNAQLYLFASGVGLTDTGAASLMSDAGGNPGSVLESLGTGSVTGVVPVLTTFNAAGTSQLVSGTTYWIALTYVSGNGIGWGKGGSPATQQRTSGNELAGPWTSRSEVFQLVVNGDTSPATTAVPEPSTLALVLLALGGAGILRRN